ncbi:MAG: carbohydrate ABC transporter permease [Candidatus Dormibacteraeota bacterium]|nr:carbohydrate ABC transporter permease [Candidatus Dormibacteraeota bacterium]
MISERVPRRWRGGGGLRQVGRLLLVLLLLLVSILWVLPLAWALDTALKPEAETTALPPMWIPSTWTLQAFESVIKAGNLLRWYLNSFIISVAVTAGVIVTSSLVAFALSRIRFSGRAFIFWFILAGIMVPGEVRVVALFYEVNMLNLVDTYWAIILPQIASPIAVFIFKQFFDGIPRELEESAVMDGASRFRVYWQIWMPLSLPVITVIGILHFVESWNNFLWPLIALTSSSMYTIPVGMATVANGTSVRYAQEMAAAVLAAAPLVIGFAIFSRQIIRGVVGTGAIKG